MPFPLRTAFGAMLVVFAVASAGACGSGFLDGLTGGVPLREDSAIPIDASAEEAGCVGRVPPDASGSADGPSLPPLAFAFEALRLTAGSASDAGAPAPVGVNLDHLCTCGGDREACVPPDAGARPPICDGDGGADDGLARFFTELGSAIPEFNDDFASARILDGDFTVLLDLYDWNGLPDDPQVLVRLRSSSGTDRVATGGRKTPLFNGKDIWQVDPGSILQGSENLGKDCRLPANVGSCTAAVADPQAYVVNGRLVAHPQNLAGNTPIIVRSSVGSISIELTNTSLEAALLPTRDGGWRLEGEIDGRWPVESLLLTIANLENPLKPGTGICETVDAGQSLYGTLKSQVCVGLDIAAGPDLDRNARAPCTAISSALSFVAGKAVAGHVVGIPPSSTNCVGWKDDCAQ